MGLRGRQSQGKGAFETTVPSHSSRTFSLRSQVVPKGSNDRAHVHGVFTPTHHRTLGHPDSALWLLEPVATCSLSFGSGELGKPGPTELRGSLAPGEPSRLFLGPAVLMGWMPHPWGLPLTFCPLGQAGSPHPFSVCLEP